MMETQNIEHEAQYSLDGTLPHVEVTLGSQSKKDSWLETIRLTVAKDFTCMLMPALHAAQIRGFSQNRYHEK